jgi:hypothetical protein
MPIIAAGITAGGSLLSSGINSASKDDEAGGYTVSPVEIEKANRMAYQNEYSNMDLPQVWNYIQPQKNPLMAAMAYNLGGDPLFVDKKAIGNRMAERKEGGTPLLNNIGARLSGRPEDVKNPILNPKTQEDRQKYMMMLLTQQYTPQQVAQQETQAAAQRNTIDDLKKLALGGSVLGGAMGI